MNRDGDPDVIEELDDSANHTVNLSSRFEGEASDPKTKTKYKAESELGTEAQAEQENEKGGQIVIPKKLRFYQVNRGLLDNLASLEFARTVASRASGNQ